MLVRAEAFFHRLRRFFTADEWMARLLGLPEPPQTGAEPGLVLVQIDGLSHAQFEHAIQRGNMPFLSRLIRREAYVSRPHYAGLPSSTPAVQGTLFYGVECCVPAFSYKANGSRQISNMFLPKAAREVEQKLTDQGAEPLLAGGSAYGDIFTGGAGEPHFCVAAIGWGSLLEPLKNPSALALTFLLSLPIFVRIAILAILEFLAAVFDGLRDIASDRNFLEELRYIPLRVAVCVVLREVIAAGAKIDIARGIPAIHMNFAGYDEQAHHRGPGSALARRSLRGIDHAIAKVWKAAQRSHRRDYDVFIYSDHGQEKTKPYSEVYGSSIDEAVNRVFPDRTIVGIWGARHGREVRSWRAGTLRNSPGKGWREETPSADEEPDKRVIVAAMGPIGHIYPPDPLSAEERDKFAADLVESAHVPLVVTSDGPGNAWAWNSKGRFMLPRQAEAVVDPGHPFFEEVVKDLVRLAHHPDAGEFVILGWRAGSPLTFDGGQGSHGGPGPEETTGFALLPLDTMPRSFGGTIRTLDLREAARHSLAHGHDRAIAAREIAREGPSTFRVMTYNVHGCLGRDGKISPSRIGRIIARHAPDVVCLQELDVLGEADQGKHIAEKLDMAFHYHPTYLMKKGKHGNAILSRHPMRLVVSGSLPRLSKSRLYEPRGAMWVELEVDGQTVQVMNTHLSLSPAERLLQVEALVGSEWLTNPSCVGPVVLCGDFNASPTSKVCRRLGRDYKNAQLDLAGHGLLQTLPLFPGGPVDHVFVGPDIKVLGIEVPRTDLERVASDHLPLIATVELPRALQSLDQESVVASELAEVGAH